MSTAAELDRLGEEMSHFQMQLLAGKPRELAQQETESAASVR